MTKIITHIFDNLLDKTLEYCSGASKQTAYLKDKVKLLQLFNFSIYGTMLGNTKRLIENLDNTDYMLEIFISNYSNNDMAAIYSILENYYKNISTIHNNLEYKIPYMSRCATGNEYLDYLDIYSLDKGKLINSLDNLDNSLQSATNKILAIIAKKYKCGMDLTLNETVFFNKDKQTAEDKVVILDYPYLIVRSTYGIGRYEAPNPNNPDIEKIDKQPLTYQVLALSEYLFKFFMKELNKYLFDYDRFLIDQMAKLQKQIDSNYNNRKVVTKLIINSDKKDLEGYRNKEEYLDQFGRIPEERA